MVRQAVGDLLGRGVSLELEGIDRMYLNGYVPSLQTGAAVAHFLRSQLDCQVPSTAMLAPMGRRFVTSIERFARAEAIELLRFERGQRKDDLARSRLSRFEGEEGVLFIGKTQEKTGVFRTTKRTDAAGLKYPWIMRSTAMVNHYYFYLVDRDFGPMFIKFCSYFPYAVKVCVNGNEWLKRQLEQRGIEFEALDNGILSCADGRQVQRIADQLDEKKIEAVFRKWLGRLPHPFSPQLRKAGYRYELSVLQAEFALTQVMQRPLQVRAFFEEMVRENLDLGRPDQVQLIFDRRITKRTPGRFRTRILTQGVIPTLHVDYKSSRIKQYAKEGRALRTETTINNTYDFQIGRRLRNLPALREIGFAANRRLLHVQHLSHDCRLGEQRFERIVQPVVHDKQRASGLLFTDPRVRALFQGLCLFVLIPHGFRHRELRERIARLLGQDPDHYGANQMTYDLRRLRLHGLIERIPSTHRYRVTDEGILAAMFFTRMYSRVLRPGLSLSPHPLTHPRNSNICRVHRAIDAMIEEARLAA